VRIKISIHSEHAVLGKNHARVLFSGAPWIFVAGASARSADLPTGKSAPGDYLRICSAYGQSFFYIPGTDTCLRVGGRVRYEFQYVQPKHQTDPITG
jgi:hypothetical protein